MNKTLIAAGIAVVLIVGGYFGYKALYPSSYGSSSNPTTNQNSNQGSNQSAQPTSTNTVTISNFDFSPKDIRVSAGTEVTFKNDDSTTHTVTGDGFDSGSIKPGAEYKKKFDSAGAYEYHCSLHASMKGRVVVE